MNNMLHNHLKPQAIPPSLITLPFQCHTDKTETLHDTTVNTYEYTYHPDRRWLTEVKKNGQVVETYQYDGNGNRSQNLEAITASTFNVADQLTQTSDAAYTYTVDGYLDTKTTVDGVTLYAYSTQGRLLGVQAPAPAASITYKHNAIGNRVAKLVNGQVVEKYLWLDKTTLLATYNADDSLKQRFEYALGHTPTSFTQGGSKYYITTDHLGSVRVISDDQGAVVKAYDYSAFGERVVLVDNDALIEIPFGFAGGLYDEDTGLVRFGYRDYDSVIGRWTARDPIGLDDGPNIYAYVKNDPVRFVDPTGLVNSAKVTVV